MSADGPPAWFGVEKVSFVDEDDAVSAEWSGVAEAALSGGRLECSESKDAPTVVADDPLHPGMTQIADAIEQDEWR